MSTHSTTIYHCGLCGATHNGAHYCPGLHPPYGSGAFTPTPLTEERIREIVREEVAKATEGLSRRYSGACGPL